MQDKEKKWKGNAYMDIHSSVNIFKEQNNNKQSNVTFLSYIFLWTKRTKKRLVIITIIKFWSQYILLIFY